ncbi:cob(I)yrinic acid a,c-diamide adenosyltransferase [Caloramator sp. E03]|uniref:cob(I)yrinic acid a,c-diamide adenosyltransferase n=1 Tax=Caloramator sp. E03 TaxID=2576307 RepID=UPI0011109DDB|nr:cob(I)yrinic acid a,c-diamide adenosyltransferase [Caloramator sp. E03]QCX34517.1 cob(I)yrinic acid a,c-diamide adenosyltransferase [Caloramator sp. E03]
MKIYTKTGDKGDTSLVGGSRTTKSDIRVWAYGTIDEANSSLGLARAKICNKEIKENILLIQKMLFEVAAEIASIGTESYKERINEEDVFKLEKLIDYYDELKPQIHAFIVPGGTEESALLDISRTIIRKSERYIVELKDYYKVNEQLLKYINRLSDAIYTFARYLDYIDIKNKVKVNIGLYKKNKLDREFARYLVDKCIVKALEIGVPMVITVVDDSGNIIIQERMDGALLASIDISKNKAYTAAIFKKPTHELKKLSEPGEELYGLSNMKNVITFGGGFPLKIEGDLFGAVGVSGGTVEEDMTVAAYAIKIFKEVFTYGVREE